MIFGELPFDPIKDIKPVEPFGFIDLKSAMANNAVPSQLPDSEVDYNGIEDPKSILGKPTDVFDAMRMEKSINEYIPPTDENNDSQ